MATETTVQVTCDRCGLVHYQGVKEDRPKHVEMSWWGIDVGWDPKDLCQSCAEDFKEALKEFPRIGPKTGNQKRSQGHVLEMFDGPDT